MGTRSTTKTREASFTARLTTGVRNDLEAAAAEAETSLSMTMESLLVSAMQARRDYRHIGLTRIWRNAKQECRDIVAEFGCGPSASQAVHDRVAMVMRQAQERVDYELRQSGYAPQEAPDV